MGTILKMFLKIYRIVFTDFFLFPVTNIIFGIIELTKFKIKVCLDTGIFTKNVYRILFSTIEFRRLLLNTHQRSTSSPCVREAKTRRSEAVLMKVWEEVSSVAILKISRAT